MWDLIPDEHRCRRAAANRYIIGMIYLSKVDVQTSRRDHGIA
jgi:hypothetical protein